MNNMLLLIDTFKIRGVTELHLFACYYSVQNLLSSPLLFKNVKIRIYKTIILPVALLGYETLTLTLKNRLRAFKMRRLWGIFGPKRDEVTRACRKLHNKEPHNLYSSPSIIRMIKSRKIKWAWNVHKRERS
jgi:hypothetical protein